MIGEDERGHRGPGRRPSPRPSTPATPRPPPRPSPKRPWSSTRTASAPWAAPPSATSSPRRSRTTPGARSRSRQPPCGSSAPETALEEGRATITPAKGAGAPEISRFTAIYVKEDGHWLQAAVRDEPAANITPHDRLKELEWLVGEWVNESQDAVVLTTCKWADNGNFLVREFTMKTQGQPVMTGTQRIGWDPVKRQFKTWIFDSEGGFGEGYWTRDGDQWVVKAEGVGQDGQPASATNIITRLGKDRVSWQSVNRTLGGAAVPGIDEFILVRKPPEIGK